MVDILNTILINAKHLLSLIGAFVIVSGALFAALRFVREMFIKRTDKFDFIRVDLARSIILGLEFIIASDVIETMSTPDYYALGILAVLVVIRTFLNYSLSKDINSISER